MQKGKFDHLLKYMEKENCILNEENSLQALQIDKFDHLLKYMDNEESILNEASTPPKSESVFQNNDNVYHPPLDLSYDPERYKDFPEVDKFFRSFEPRPSLLKKIFTAVFGIFFFLVIFLALGLACTYGAAPLETLMPRFLAFFVFTVTAVFFSPISSILIIIGLFMDSTPPAWIGLIVLLPGIPFMLAQSGIGVVKSIYSKITAGFRI